jgi:hypothetical protein
MEQGGGWCSIFFARVSMNFGVYPLKTLGFHFGQAIALSEA